MKHNELTALILAHDEGYMLCDCAKSILSAWENRAKATNYIDLAFLFVLDNPSAETIDAARQISSILVGGRKASSRILVTSFGDPGLARNAGIKTLDDKSLVLLIDSDDLVGSLYFSLFEVGQDLTQGRLILHPEFLVNFQQKSIVYRQLPCNWQKVESLAAAFFSNPYDLNMIASAALLKRCQFHGARQDAGYGYEDWHFTLGTLLVGVVHDTIPRAIKYTRVKRASRNLLDRLGSSLTPPLGLDSIHDHLRVC